MTDTISRAEFDAALERIEELEDAIALMKARAADDGLRIPIEVVDAKSRGDHPLGAWRKHQRFTIERLSEASGVGAATISGIENRECSPSDEARRALAAALGIDGRALLEEAAD